MLDRTQAPAFVSINSFELPEIQRLNDNSDLPVYYLENKNLSVFRLELVFRAGSWFGKNSTDAFFTSQCLSMGTKNKSTQEINQIFEGMGVQFECTQGFEYFTVRILGLNTYFETSVDLLFEILQGAIFSENDLEISKDSQIQAYKIGLEKPEVLVNHMFRERLFGENRYGKVISDEDIKLVKRDSLVEFYNNLIAQSFFKSYLSGNVSSTQIAFYLSKIKDLNVKNQNSLQLHMAKPKQVFFEKSEKENSLQAAIKMGNLSIGRNHADYIAFLVYNTILGGYFGSRLMKNIREEKGLTYGISSSSSPFGPNWVWSINSSVKKENVEIVLSEIAKEMQILKTSLVSDSEITTVKNYIAGSILVLLTLFLKF
jgi:zinc protease